MYGMENALASADMRSLAIADKIAVIFDLLQNHFSNAYLRKFVDDKINFFPSVIVAPSAAVTGKCRVVKSVKR